MNENAVDFSRRFPRPERRLALRVTPDALRQIRGGSPWVYDRSVTDVRSGDRSPAAGDLGVIFDSNRAFAAIGLYDPLSPIRLRVLASGSPQTIDAAFFERRVLDALRIRSGLADDPETTAYRCINGENDGFGGLVADLYNGTLVLKVYTPAWFPWLDLVIAPLVAATRTETVILRLARSVAADAPDLDGMALSGTPPQQPLVIVENGLRLEADVVSGQKTGHFLDQRDNRRALRRLGRGSTMLDVFSCTGGFALNAAAGGATEITCVDRSAAALDAVEANFALNASLPSVQRAQLETIRGDAFAVMEELASQGRRFHTVVVDPPSFTPRESSRARAEESYRRLAVLSVALCGPGGMLLSASCSARISAERFESLVVEGLRASGRHFRIERRTGHAPDHPVTFAHGAYLKALFTALDDGPGAGNPAATADRS